MVPFLVYSQKFIQILTNFSREGFSCKGVLEVIKFIQILTNFWSPW
jgi:hypothetical protein